MKKAISYLLIFIGIQLIGGAIISPIWTAVAGTADMTTAKLITTTVLISCITIFAFLFWHWTEVSPRWIRTRPFIVLMWSVIAAIGALVPSMWLQELMPELPNWMDNEFDMILSNRWGYLTIGRLSGNRSVSTAVRGNRATWCCIERTAEVAKTVTVGCYCCLGSILLPDTHEPRSDAPCLCHWSATGLDVLAHRVDTAWSGLSLGQQQYGIHFI